jgi:hypothetical protein
MLLIRGIVFVLKFITCFQSLGCAWHIMVISAACCLILCIYLCFGISLFLHVFPAHLDIAVVYKVFCGLKPVHWSGDQTNQNGTKGSSGL